MAQSKTTRRLLLVAVASCASLLLGLFLLRTALVALGAGVVLHGLGANDVAYEVTRATPWHVTIENVKYRMGTQLWTIRRLGLERAHWWSPSLGTLRVEGLETPVNVAELIASSKPSAAAPPPVAPTPPEVPLDGLSLDGRLVVQIAGQPDQPLSIAIEARPETALLWKGSGRVVAPGAQLQGAGRWDFGRNSGHFDLSGLRLELKAWPGLARLLVPAGWDFSGRLEGSASGDWTDGKLKGTGELALREGRVESTKPAVVAADIEARIEIADLATFASASDTLRVGTVQFGKLALQDVQVGFASEGLERIRVERAAFRTLGGTVSTEPFVFAPGHPAFDAVLNVDGIDIEQVLALTKDLPASASGRVSGRFPVRIAGDGLQFGTGWLGLKPGVSAEVRFNANGLLTSGLSAKSPAYGVLQQVETGLLKLKVSELRLEMHPPGAPPGRSAQLHLVGEPVDPTVKAPVTLDLNVNGPLEKLLNLGMDSRLSFGAAK